MAKGCKLPSLSTFYIILCLSHTICFDVPHLPSVFVKEGHYRLISLNVCRLISLYHTEL